jgi:hypothetical protein
LIYCGDIANFVRFAGPIGRYLALRGRPLVIVDANGPIPGLVGVYRPAACRNTSKGRSVRASAISPTPNTRCSGFRARVYQSVRRCPVSGKADIVATAHDVR